MALVALLERIAGRPPRAGATRATFSATKPSHVPRVDVPCRRRRAGRHFAGRFSCRIRHPCHVVFDTVSPRSGRGSSGSRRNVTVAVVAPRFAPRVPRDEMAGVVEIADREHRMSAQASVRDGRDTTPVRFTRRLFVLNTATEGKGRCSARHARRWTRLVRAACSARPGVRGCCGTAWPAACESADGHMRSGDATAPRSCSRPQRDGAVVFEHALTARSLVDEQPEGEGKAGRRRAAVSQTTGRGTRWGMNSGAAGRRRAASLAQSTVCGGCATSAAAHKYGRLSRRSGRRIEPSEPHRR